MSTAAALRDIAAMICVTALALAHLIPGSTAVALLAPFLALRALAALRPPPGGGPGQSVAGELPAAPTPRRLPRRHRARVMLEAGVVAVCRVMDPLADAAALVGLEGALAVLVHQLRRGLAGGRLLLLAMARGHP